MKAPALPPGADRHVPRAYGNGCLLAELAFHHQQRVDPGVAEKKIRAGKKDHGLIHAHARCMSAGAAGEESKTETATTASGACGHGESHTGMLGAGCRGGRGRLERATETSAHALRYRAPLVTADSPPRVRNLTELLYL